MQLLWYVQARFRILYTLLTFILGDAEEFDNHHHRQFHQQGTKHAIVLKLSPLHTLELWCNSCVKAVRFLH